MSSGEESASNSNELGRRNWRTREFKRQFDRLPERIQTLARRKFELFRTDPRHASLRLHRIRDNRVGEHLAGTFSVSITMDYRALFVVRGQSNVWYWVGSHSEYNRFLGQGG